MSFTEYQGEVIPLADEFTEYSGEVIPLDGAPKTKRTWGEAISETGEKVASGVTAVGEELGKLRDSFFTGVDNTRASANTVATAAQATQLQKSQDKLAELMSYGQGDTPEAQGLRTTIEHYSKRMPKMIGDMTDAQADAQRGAAMTTRPAVAAMGEAKTFGEAWDIFKKNPYDVIAGVTATSLPGTLPALVVGATMGPAAGAAAMGGSSAITEAGSSIADFARDSGVDTTDRKAVEAFFANRENLAAAMSYAGKRAGIIGALDAASGGIAGKTIAPAFKSAIARQAVNVPAQMAVQAGMGAGGEAGAQIATKGEIDKPGEVLMEAAGELGGAPTEVAAFSQEARAAFSKPKPTAADITSSDVKSVDQAIAIATAAVETTSRQSAVDAGQSWQAIAPSLPAEDLAMQRQISQAADNLAERARITAEREGAARSTARDSNLANIGQQWQALGITAPQDDLQAQRAGMRPIQDGTTPDIQRVPATSSGTDGPIAAESVGNGAVDVERLGADTAGLGNSGVVESGQLPAVDVAGPLSFPFVKSESGTVLVTGNPVEIRAAFPGLTGATKFTDGQPSGVLFGTSAAPSVLAKLETPSVQNQAPRTETEATQAAPTQAPAAARPIATGQPAARADAGSAKLEADGLKSAIVEIKDAYGRTNRVYETDLKGGADRIPTIRKNGEVLAGEEIPRSIIPSAKPADQRLVPMSKRVTPQKQEPAPQGKRVTTTEQELAPTAPQPKEVSRFLGKFGKGMGKDAARLEAKRLNRISTDKTVTYSAEEHNDPKLENPYAVVGRKAVEQKPTPALVEPAQAATETVASERAKTPEKAEVQPTDAAPEAKPETPADPVADAKATLDANNITGKERLDIIKDVKAGTLTAEEVKEAYPEKVDKMDVAEPAKPDDSVRLEAKSSIGLEQPVQEKPRNPFGTPTTVTALQAAIKELTGMDGMNKMGRIVATTASEIKSTWEPLLGKSVNIESEGDAGAAQGFFDPKSKTIFLISDHIREGAETAVLAHELMHKYGKTVLGKEGWDRLHSVIGTWANADRESNEHAVYNYARNKVEAVGAALSNQELMPYCVEAAFKLGIEPDMQAGRGTVARWLESVRQNMKMVWAKITGKPETFKAQDLVNLAFGLSQMENPEYSSIANDFENQRASSNIESAEDENERTTGNSEAAGGRQQNSIQDMATSLGGKPAPRGWSSATRISRAGRPITVYRGAAEPLNVSHFGKSSLGKASGNPSSGLGVWFTTGKGEAQTYGKASSHNLDIRNPKLIRAEQLPGFDSVDEAHAYREELRKQGYDGILISARHLGKQELHIVAFDPDQVIDPNGGIQFSRSAVVGQTSPHSWNAPEASKFDDLVYKLQDKQIDTKRVIEEIRKTGKALADENDVYLQEELFHGRAAARTEDFVNNELSPLITEMKMRGIDIATLDEYLHARHAQEANDLIAERNPEIQDGGSGMTTKAARDYLDKLDPAERKRLEAVAAKVDAILGKTRQMYADYNLESQSTVNGWGQMFEHYVPLMREDKDGAMGIGQGFSIKGKETKGRTGSTRKVVDILANIAMQRERAIVRGEKNRVATALVGLAELNPNEDFWAVGPPPTEKVYDQKSNTVVERADPLFKSRENVVVAKVKEPSGEVVEKAVRFNEDNERAVRMAVALKNLDAAQLNGLLGVSAKISRYFAAINTQWNPIFGTVNLVRDFQGAILNLSTTALKNHKAEIAGHTLAALKGVYLDARAAREGKPQTSAWAKLWEDFQNEGGQTGYRDMFANSNDRAKAIESELNPTKWMDSTLGKIFTANGNLKVPMEIAQKKAAGLFGWLSDYNLAMENAVRLSAYKVGLEQGMSKQQAASLAKNLTVNFNRKGQVGQQAGAVYAFFNASMQGTARLGQTLFDMDGSDTKTIRLSATGKKIVYGGVMLGVMQALLLAAAGFDDEEPPDFVRERSLIIPTGGKSYITIPMPLGLHVLPNMGRIPTEFVLGGFKQPVKSIVKLLGLTAGAFNPIGGGASLTQMLAPTAVDPLVALAENKDWTGKPIAKTSYNKATPGFALTKDTASYPSKVLAEAINLMTGGTKYTAGMFSPTPDQIDYLWGQATGGVGRELSKVQQSVSAALSGEDLPVHKIPLVGRFYGDAETQSAQSSKFYSTINRLNEHEAEIKGLMKDRKTAELREYMAENPEAKLYTLANKVELDVQKLRRMKRELIAADAPPERIKDIEMRITKTMTRFNEYAAMAKKPRATATAP